MEHMLQVGDATALPTHLQRCCMQQFVAAAVWEHVEAPCGTYSSRHSLRQYAGCCRSVSHIGSAEVTLTLLILSGFKLYMLLAANVLFKQSS
jgi:hypothetical protein